MNEWRQRQHVCDKFKQVLKDLKEVHWPWLSDQAGMLKTCIGFCSNTSGNCEYLLMEAKGLLWSYLSFLQGDLVQPAQDWTIRTRKALKDFAAKLLPKIIANKHGPLSQQTGLKMTRAANSKKGKGKAKE